MQIRDLAEWQAMVKDLKASEPGQVFYEFLMAWADHAEQIMAQSGDDANPAEALRITLPVVEETLERKTIWIVGQCLVVLCMHWKFGEELSRNFTEVEVRLVEDVTAMKIAQLEASAEQPVMSE